MTTTPTVADILRRAADRIEPEGAWTRLSFERNGSDVPVGVANIEEAEKVCAWTAILLEGGSRIIGEATKAFVARHGAHVMQLNDAPGRTQAEVVAALRAAADAWEAENG